MNIKILYHIMPWEIDYALFTFTQLKKSKYYLPEEVNITVESVLNLSSYLINWEESKLPKEYFIEKYNTLSNLLVDYKHINRIYEGNELYGHLNMQTEGISPEINYYINICPDMYFSEYLLHYITQTLSNINDQYFVLSPQHRKLSDSSWDSTTDPDYLHIPYSEYNNVDLFDIRYNNKQKENEISVELSQNGKYAGWFDVYSKAFYEDLSPAQDDWKGYGPWDWYSLILTNYAKQHGVDFKHYVLRGLTIGEYWTGPLQQNDGFSGYYKNQITRNIIPDQRKQFEASMEQYVTKGIKMLKDKNII